MMHHVVTVAQKHYEDVNENAQIWKQILTVVQLCLLYIVLNSALNISLQTEDGSQ